MNGPKIYFTIPLFGGIDITQTTVSSFVVMLLLCIAAVVLGSNLQKRPSRRQVLVEKGVTMLYDMVESTMGKHNSYWTPYIAAVTVESNVDFPTLGKPTKPTSASNFNSSVKTLSSAGIPGSAKCGACLVGVQNLQFPLPPFPPLAMTKVSSLCERSAITLLLSKSLTIVPIGTLMYKSSPSLP